LKHYELSAAKAWHRFNENPAARWSNGLQFEPEEGTAWQRITAAPFFDPMLRPACSITRDDKVFAIGSCFARHIEGALKSLGFRVESLTSAFDDFPTDFPRNGPIGFTNKFNPLSILQELRWALEPGAEFPAEALVELETGGEWEDPHASPVFEQADLETTLRRHRMLTDVTRHVAECRLVVITLGLIETFFDTTTDLYANSTPSISNAKGRFRFRVLSHEQVLDALKESRQLLVERGHPDVQIFVTVSPVPLSATFTDEDVVVANTLGKSLLRAAAGEWSGRHDNVHYFPAYEIVLNSQRDLAWEQDGRHVRHELVQHIMQRFVDAYVAPEIAPPVATAR
jgi:hypothetical protein